MNRWRGVIILDCGEAALGEGVPAGKGKTGVRVLVAFFDHVVTGMELRENGFANFLRAVGHGAVKRQVMKKDDVAGFGFDDEGFFERIVFKDITLA
jgi:hypothetical protein